LSITIAIFVWISKPIVQNWDRVKDHVQAVSWYRLVLASAMFAFFLFVFRAMAWRRILRGFGYPLPVAPALRIWTTSELARYLPGVIWQVVGRAYLARPYGVSGTVCSTSQVLELVIFLLANVLVAITCLLWNGNKHLPHGAARLWLRAAMWLVPVLFLLLHPKVFYGLMNGILRRLGKPLITQQLGFGLLAGLLLWNVIGLIWQSFAIWILTAGPLDLQFTKWWVVAGSGRNWRARAGLHDRDAAGRAAAGPPEFQRPRRLARVSGVSQRAVAPVGDGGGVTGIHMRLRRGL
jgi:hypothetical protein